MATEETMLKCVNSPSSNGHVFSKKKEQTPLTKFKLVFSMFIQIIYAVMISHSVLPFESRTIYFGKKKNAQFLGEL